jgi:type II secretory pathway pseudopilin PulG
MPSARRSSSFWSLGGESGLSKVELVAGIAILAMLAGLGWICIAPWLEHARITRAMESARTLNTLLSQYGTDNDGVYPVGLGTSAPGKSEGIARNLLANNYAPDASLFALGSATRYAGKAPDFSDLTAASISWDFTAGASSTAGITSAAPDLLPTLYTTGQNVIYPTTPGAGLDLPLSESGPFGKSGMVVAEKGGGATFIPGAPSGPTVICHGFISGAFKGTGPYTQIRP